MPKETRDSFATLLKSLIEESKLTYREIANITEKVADKGYSASYISQLVQGSKPTPENMEVLAMVFGVEPTEFREYDSYIICRLALAAQEKHGSEIVKATLRGLDSES